MSAKVDRPGKRSRERRPAMGKAETKIAERYAELTVKHSIGT